MRIRLVTKYFGLTMGYEKEMKSFVKWLVAQLKN